MSRSVPLHPAIRALRRSFRDDGARGAARHAVERLRAQIYERDCHFVVVKDLATIPVPVRRGVVRVEELTREHLPALSELNREREDLTGDRRFAGDLGDGYRGFVALRDERLVGFYWWADRTMPPHREFRGVALGVELGPGDVYGTDFYIGERDRGAGAAPDFLFHVETALRARGFERLWGTVQDSNRAARWVYAARGYESRWAVVGTRSLRRWRYRTERLDSANGA